MRAWPRTRTSTTVAKSFKIETFSVRGGDWTSSGAGNTASITRLKIKFVC